jgi:hypothetical protein
MTKTSHAAVGPALGYYYQGIYALILLLDSISPNAFVSIETLDDVVLDDGGIKELHQLKHSITKGSTISVKSDQLWKTIKVWCDFLITSEVKEGIFTLSTVSDLAPDSPLNTLKDPEASRDVLETELLKEANRVIEQRKVAEEENNELLLSSQKPKDLPFAIKYKGCESFLELDEITRKHFLSAIKLRTSQFSIEKAVDEVVLRIKNTTKAAHHRILAKSIISWWEREAVESLTRERESPLAVSELQEFISLKNSELFHDGFTDDSEEIEIPPILNPHPVHQKQLQLIGATRTQERRSFETEIKARIQRQKWLDDNLPAAKKLEKYDLTLINEWSYKFGEIEDEKESLSEEEIKEKGRGLLDWSHNAAHLQVVPISKYYNQPDLIRGSYQMLSSKKKVGWHCNFESLIDIANERE